MARCLSIVSGVKLVFGLVQPGALGHMGLLKHSHRR